MARINVATGVVRGSDLARAKGQLGEDFLDIFDWAFPDNGLNAYKDGMSIAVQSLKKHLGDGNINRFINWVLRYLSEGIAHDLFTCQDICIGLIVLLEQLTFLSRGELSLSFAME